MKRSAKSEKVIRAIAIGLSAFMVSASPMTTLAATADTTPDNEDNVGTENKDDVQKTASDNKEVSDAVENAETVLEDTIKDSLDSEKDASIIKNLEVSDENLVKVEGEIKELDDLNKVASDKKNAYEEATSTDKKDTLDLAVDAAEGEQENAEKAADAAEEAAEKETEK